MQLPRYERPTETGDRDTTRILIQSLNVEFEKDENKGQDPESVIQKFLKTRVQTQEDLEHLFQAILTSHRLPDNLKQPEKREAALRAVRERQEEMRREQEQRNQLREQVEASRQISPPPDAKEDPWFPQSMNPREWSGKQIAVVSTLTVGAIGIGYGLWRWWRGSDNDNKEKQPQETSEKKGWSRLVYWIPGIGLAVAGAYGLHKLLMKFDKYEKGYERIMAMLKGEKKEQYGLSEEELKHADKLYWRTRGTDPEDMKKIRLIFGLKDGEENPQFTQFLQNMKEKYETREEQGVRYERADAALHNYEEYLKVALDELGHWIASRGTEIVVLEAILHKTGILRIETILKGAEAVAVKSAKIAAELAKTAIKHPLISLFTVGGTVLGMRAALATGKKLYLPENFHQLGKAFSTDAPIVLGDAADFMRNQLSSLKGSAVDLVQVGADFGAWVGGAIADFGKKVLEAAPDAIGLTKEEVVKTRNLAGLENLRRVITNKKRLAPTSAQQAREGAVKRYEDALHALDEFQRVFIAQRCEQVTASDEPQRAFERLLPALSVIGITVDVKDGIARWKTDDQEATDLCIDPALKEPDRIYALSKVMRQGDEGEGNYIFFRALHALREKQQRGTEFASEWLTGGNKVAAMIIGPFVYFTDPENQWEYWTAPVSVCRELFGDDTWSQKLAVTGEAAAGAAIMTLNAGVFARLKRFAIGGGPLVARSWRTYAVSINPITSPLKLVRDMARGAIDFETFVKLGRWGEDGGHFFNTLLGRAGIRPEWIGLIEQENVTKKNLEWVAKKVGAGHLSNMDVRQARFRLRKHMLGMLKTAQTQSISRLQGSVHALNYGDMYRAAAQWFENRSLFSKAAGVVANSIDATLDLPRRVGAIVMGGVRESASWTGRKAAQGVKAAAEGFAGPRTLPELEDRFLKAMSGKGKLSAVEADDALKLLDKSGLKDPKTLRLFTNSPHSQRIFARAMKSANPAAEMDRVLRGARTARNWRVGFGAVGVTGDVFGILIATADILNNGGRIEQARQTGNEELAEMYKSAYPIYGVEGATSLAGLVVAGISVKAAIASGAGLMAGLGAPLAVTLAPVTIAVLAVGHTYRKLEEGAEYLLTREQDLLGKAPGSILEHVGKSRDDSRVNWVMGTLAAVDSVDYASADQMARIKGYMAYFTQVSYNVLPAADTYTPTRTIVSDCNTDGTAAHDLRYLRIKNIVHVSGIIEMNVTGSPATFRLSLPFASTLSVADQLNGLCIQNSSGGAGSDGVKIIPNSNTAYIQFNATGGVQTFTVDFTYEIL